MPERRITAEKPTAIKPASVPKAQEKELARFTEFMIRELSAVFRKDVLESMSPKAVDTFEDAEAVNFAAEYAKAAAAVRGKLAKRFGDAKIRALIDKILKKVDKRNQSVLYSAVERAIGLSTKELSATEGLRAKIDAYIEETTQWVIKLREDTITEYTARSLQAMSLGQSLEDVLKQYDGMVEQRKNHAKFTARNQIANFNSMATKTRAQNLGITEGIWRVADRSKRTRPGHLDRDGKKFKLDKGLYSAVDQKWLLPGVDFQCRCDYELVIPEA